jgi:hypothetical protein
MDADANHHIWRTWANNLQRWGMSDLVAAFLEAAGPFAFLGAQVIYLGQPLLSGLAHADDLQALTCLLEDGEQVRDFTRYLREESPT